MGKMKDFATWCAEEIQKEMPGITFERSMDIVVNMGSDEIEEYYNKYTGGNKKCRVL